MSDHNRYAGSISVQKARVQMRYDSSAQAMICVASDPPHTTLEGQPFSSRDFITQPSRLSPGAMFRFDGQSIDLGTGKVQPEFAIGRAGPPGTYYEFRSHTAYSDLLVFVRDKDEASESSAQVKYDVYLTKAVAKGTEEMEGRTALTLSSSLPFDPPQPYPVTRTTIDYASGFSDPPHAGAIVTLSDSTKTWARYFKGDTIGDCLIFEPSVPMEDWQGFRPGPGGSRDRARLVANEPSSQSDPSAQTAPPDAPATSAALATPAPTMTTPTVIQVPPTSSRSLFSKLLCGDKD
ncbi:hypothetical protein IAU60_000404 [Kwoniella sp. DSM 27419]